MNKKIATQAGIITGLLILCLNIFLIQLHLNPQSKLQLLQFVVLFFGLVGSCFVLNKHYAGIEMLDFFKHCMRTIATTMFLVIVGSVILFIVYRKPNDPWSGITWMIMKTIFSYSMSGLLSAFCTSFLFNTFTKK